MQFASGVAEESKVSPKIRKLMVSPNPYFFGSIDSELPITFYNPRGTMGYEGVDCIQKGKKIEVRLGKDEKQGTANQCKTTYELEAPLLNKDGNLLSDWEM